MASRGLRVTPEYAITIKVNGGSVEDRLRVFEHARGLDRPDGWGLGRPGKRESFRVWKRNAEEMTAAEAAEATLEAGEFSGACSEPDQLDAMRSSRTALAAIPGSGGG